MRGKILSVIDLRTFFDLPNRGLSDLNKVIVLHDGTMEFGVLADAIIAARWIPRSDLLPSLPTLTEIRAEYIVKSSFDQSNLLEVLNKLI